MNVINLPKSERVEITGIKLNLKCKNCGHLWGTYLTTEYLPQDNWDVCLRCLNNMNAKENMNNEIQQVLSGESRK